MSRPGVSYDTVKMAAVKLLSQGTSPSVQKIRDILGTGSNTTLAEHLKRWREEYTSKEVHYLPADMPKELISTFEVLWQTAMEHAEKQLAHIKEELGIREETMRQEKSAHEKGINDLTHQLSEAKHNTALKEEQIQALQQQLIIEQQRVLKTEESAVTQQQQHENRMKYALEEKHSAFVQVNSLQKEIGQLQNQLTAQVGKHQSELTTERQRQDESEQRWMHLIDKSQQETHLLRKQFEQYKRQSEQTQQILNQKLYDLQAGQHEQAANLRISEEKMNQLHQKNAQLVTEKGKLATTIDSLRSKLDNMRLVKAKKEQGSKKSESQ